MKEDWRCVRQIEQAKQKLEQVTDELKVVKNNLAEVQTKLGTLEGQPERYRKQVRKQPFFFYRTVLYVYYLVHVIPPLFPILLWIPRLIR